jgi:hypothetical protein
MSERHVPESAAAPSGSQAKEPVRTPFCRELRSKSFYLLTTFPSEAGQYLDDSNHCWCYLTQEPIGPDGEKVSPYRCVSTRGCYRSALEELA